MMTRRTKKKKKKLKSEMVTADVTASSCVNIIFSNGVKDKIDPLRHSLCKCKKACMFDDIKKLCK